jgi:3-isopropylmalate/(R)-2-methylmalate dehydratase small subunit
MQPFVQVTSVAAPIRLINVDTDMIFPKNFLKTVSRFGLSRGLFAELRFDTDNCERRDFVLNWKEYRNAGILVAGDNFGCGSSREHAVWALMDFGISCVISSSFADIFFNNCIQNGILPARVGADSLEALFDITGNPDTAVLCVDLRSQTIAGAGKSFDFDIPPYAKDMLLEGQDAIGMTDLKRRAIDDFEKAHIAARPWQF